jgi:hypothetical protein
VPPWSSSRTLLLRPLARRVDRLPASDDSEVETIYKFSAVCDAADEAHIRAQVVQALTRGEFVLRAVHSEDLDPGSGRVEVAAELQVTAGTTLPWRLQSAPSASNPALAQ